MYTAHNTTLRCAHAQMLTCKHFTHTYTHREMSAHTNTRFWSDLPNPSKHQIMRIVSAALRRVS